MVALNLVYNKNRLYKTLNFDTEIYSILTFQKRTWKQFLYHTLFIIFQEKCFSCYIRLTDLTKFHIRIAIASEILDIMCIEILENMYIVIVCLPGCDVIKFQINLTFLIKPFFYMTKRPRKKFKYLENEKSF